MTSFEIRFNSSYYTSLHFGLLRYGVIHFKLPNDDDDESLSKWRIYSLSVMWIESGPRLGKKYT